MKGRRGWEVRGGEGREKNGRGGEGEWRGLLIRGGRGGEREREVPLGYYGPPGPGGARIVTVVYSRGKYYNRAIACSNSN